MRIVEERPEPSSVAPAGVGMHIMLQETGGRYGSKVSNPPNPKPETRSLEPGACDPKHEIHLGRPCGRLDAYYA